MKIKAASITLTVGVVEYLIQKYEGGRLEVLWWEDTGENGRWEWTRIENLPREVRTLMEALGG